jgi:hypothetical protein
MEWIFFIGAVIYYLYKAYQQEAQKNVNKPLTPVNKPVRPGQASTKPAPKTLEEVWQELKEAANQQEMQPEVEVIDRVPEKPVEKKITSIEYDTMFGREEKELKSIEYDDSLFRTGENLDKIPFEEGGTRPIPNQETEPPLKPREPKYFKIRGKKMSPKDTFVASIIWERKVS